MPQSNFTVQTEMNTSLNINYDFPVSVILDKAKYVHRVKLMKAAGVKTVWLNCFLYGFWESSVKDIERAKSILESDGFEVQALTVPLGHGSQALDPSMPIDENIRPGWQRRMDSEGSYIINTACINDHLIKDSHDAAKALCELGISKIFYDDDLRMGSWGPALQGCFCDRCLDRFHKKYPEFDGMSRNDIIKYGTEGSPVRKAWENIQCSSVIRFLKDATPTGMAPGIMIMHNGDRRHGLDIEAIKNEIPNVFFRIGEGHFNDDSFNCPDGCRSISVSILRHLNLIGSTGIAYSESTVYPIGALSPNNWIKKMKIEIACGLRNIFLMSGTGFLTDEYWNALIKALPSLEEMAKESPCPDFAKYTTDKSPFIWNL